MKHSIPPAPRGDQSPSFPCNNYGVIFAIILCLAMLSLSAYAQSGRKAAPTRKPSPAQSGSDPANSEQDEQTATNGKIAGEGEDIEDDTDGGEG